MKGTCIGPLCLLIILSFLFPGCSKKPELIEMKCSSCHKSSVVYHKKRSLEDWDRLVFGMEGRGLKLTPDERKEIMAILAKKYSTGQ